MDTPKTLNILNSHNILEIRMQNRKKVEKRNVVLKIETYERLERFKVQLISEKNNSRLSFDDAINNLLDNFKKV